MQSIHRLAAHFPMLDARALELLQALPEIYAEWNTRVNLISRRDIGHLLLHHVAHSLALCHVAPLYAGATVLDFGTGGGFPGIPLAIAYPDTQFHLVDSIGKKIRAVNDIVQRLQLRNVVATQARGEELNQRYTHVVSRAVTQLDQLWRWTRPLLLPPTEGRMHGLYVYKGGTVRAEAAPFGIRARLWNIHDYLPEEYFDEKYIVHIPSLR